MGRHDDISEAERAQLIEAARFKTHGRKKGKVTDDRLSFIQERLPQLQPPRCANREELLHALGADPQQARLVLEVGFGNGDTLSELAARHPEDRFIGIDVFLEGFGVLLRKLEANAATNVRLLRGHAHPMIDDAIPDASLDWVIVNFPDPWRKKRHFKRRIIQTDFLDLLARKLRPGAAFTLATDWENYAEWMLEHIDPHPAFENLAGVGQFAPQPDWWIITNFERKGWLAGRKSHYLSYRRR
ncbi:tRNA (guanosine(46)-N7)-methyltransferase TrmB [Magnetofaba australis]|uniref:tRNA (guanine-N(7)-)-methyltransferase n=1 Tax=Magnetofaba australis IT-1 TaxID=1434232 RepID=A0A1Y2JZ10_9PROT|nr:tRNA (guanosine(46)-N7)-methyltransferase TrmB [Magnetofaba australis]OSM00135.1 putative tRNA (guanine-N(7)-)-methyltransferase [Magnetofaba australis IT-1]